MNQSLIFTSAGALCTSPTAEGRRWRDGASTPSVLHPAPRTSAPGALAVRQHGSSSSQASLILRRGGMMRATGGAGGRRQSSAAPAASPATVDSLLARFPMLPKLIVFDLDYTLWPFWCEMFTSSHTPWLYPDVPAILDGLREAGIQLAVASRTPTPHVANTFLDKLQLRSRFGSIQLIPASDGFDQHSAQKDKAHLPRIQRETGHAYSDMLFFDDEHGNIRKVSRLGVVSILVDTSTGVSLAALEEGLVAYARAKQGAGPNGAVP